MTDICNVDESGLWHAHAGGAGQPRRARAHAAATTGKRTRGLLDEYVERAAYDALGRVASRIDARFLPHAGSPQANFAYLPSLSNQVLRTDSVDAGTHWTLPDADGRPVGGARCPRYRHDVYLR